MIVKKYVEHWPICCLVSFEHPPRDLAQEAEASQIHTLVPADNQWRGA